MVIANREIFIIQIMSPFVYFLLFLPLVVLVLGNDDDCMPTRCRGDGPIILFPFRQKNQQPQQCGYPGFDLYCDHKNDTVLVLPFSVNVVVKEIDYAFQTILVYDQEMCLTQKLPRDLNLSASPFLTNYFTDADDYTLFNCSDPPGRDLRFGSILAAILLVAFLYLYIRVRIYRENRTMIGKFLRDYGALKPSRFSYSAIKRITHQFNEKLGEGGYGIVYKGKLNNEIDVAVKVLNNSKGNGEEFVNEVSTIGRIHHVNIVRLLGFCADGFRRALVYEFLPNGSLEKSIFQAGSNRIALDWEKLKDIALGIAKGIEYLHEGCDQQILHFDIKPQNVLLDHNLNPKICDFGLAKLCSKEQSAVTMTAARGTMGYIAPEVLSRTFGRVSYKSDVYSFGMLLLEMVGGRKNEDHNANNTSQVYFPQWIYNHINVEDNPMWAQIDEEGNSIARKLSIVGLWCIQWCPTDRPSMKVVVQMLEGECDDLTLPPNPFPATTNPIDGKHYQTQMSIILEE
ncbi:PREDICTED: probable receptor-like protein kinase At1g67000 [Erythranthe guttata]|uniref:probable receptor-like protein kinase At1g67000 n=1 Tax=Erythranthe guttata TaxID=4155 RepID=UPI00064D8E94|nr:PREDICTED: probable receptor-like protein kinase At1g67000 [Erythranthe guttata]|eukprot:XP_012856969.1 PREDICTED: probable receptor-like protein kinase At1g67000 [Erythranthe guttata]